MIKNRFPQPSAHWLLLAAVPSLSSATLIAQAPCDAHSRNRGIMKARRSAPWRA